MKSAMPVIRKIPTTVQFITARYGVLFLQGRD